MALGKLGKILNKQLILLEKQGVRKGTEHCITTVIPPGDGYGPRYYIEGYGDKRFIRMNSNSYLGLSFHPKVIAGEEKAARMFGTGPAAVRFISGTFKAHVKLEERLAKFHNREAGMIFSSAYAAVLGVLPSLISEKTIVLSDALNHNCIINALRLAKPLKKAIYQHLDLRQLENRIKESIDIGDRLIVVTDGIFSMRGDFAPLDKIAKICSQYEEYFQEGIITVADDSHGVGAFGKNGKGVEEYTGCQADILIATLGKAFGVNGGYVVTDKAVIDYLRESAPLYIYSNPITPGEAEAALQAIDIVDSAEGLYLLQNLKQLTEYFEAGLQGLGLEIIQSQHPIVPVLIRDTARTAELVNHLFKNGVLATGLKYPVVPQNEEEIRFQVSADHTKMDINAVLNVLAKGITR